MRTLSLADRLLVLADHSLRTLCVTPKSQRPHPDETVPDAELSPAEQRHSAGLMRVNHCGEICAQALYQGQALTARSPVLRGALQHAAWEENEHLAWTARRVQQLGSHTSYLNPLWYGGSLLLGIGAGLVGDRWNLGFLAETEDQVVRHLESHLADLPQQDAASRAIVAQMRLDEAEHASLARTHGAADLPEIVRLGMRFTARVMTGSSYYL